MDGNKTGFGKVIQAVSEASAEELRALASIKDSVDALRHTAGPVVNNTRLASRSVSKNNETSNKNRSNDNEKASGTTRNGNAAFNDALNIISSRNSNEKTVKSPRNERSDSNEQSNNNKNSRKKRGNNNNGVNAETSDDSQENVRGSTSSPEDMSESASKARKAYRQRSRKTENAGQESGPATRDARGRFISRAGSKDATEAARKEQQERQQAKSGSGSQDDSESLLKKLTSALSEMQNPTEMRAVDAAGYGVAGPFWAAGKELMEVGKEVGSGINSTRKTLASFMGKKGDKNNGSPGLMSRMMGAKTKNSADVVQLNTQRQAVNELENQTEAIREGDKAIIDRLDTIAGNTKEKKGGLLKALSSMLGGAGKKLLALLGMKGAGRLAGGTLMRGAGRLAGGAFGMKMLSKIFGAGGREAAGAAGGAGEAGAGGLLSKIGMKGLAKAGLRAIPILGTLAGGAYDAVKGWNDEDGQRKTFGLSDQQDPSLQQKAAYTMGNVLDMGGLVSGISSALGSVLESLGFTDIGKALQFTTADIAKAIDSGITQAEAAISGLGETITSTFTEYTEKIGETVSGWFGEIGGKFDEAIQGIKDFFTVDNLAKVFQDAMASVIEFIKHPVESIKKGAGEVLDKAKNSASAAGDWLSEKYHAAKEALTGDGKSPGVVQKGVEKVKAVAQSAGETATTTVSKIAHSPVVKSASGAIEKMSESTGQAAMATANTARAASGDSDVMKAAETYNNGNANVKVNSLNKAGAQNLQSMDPYLKTLEMKYSLPEGILHAVAATESGGDPNAVSPTGALGMYQFTSIARKDVGISEDDAKDPHVAADAAARLLSKYNKQAGGDWNDTITGYNAGMGTVKNWREGKGDLSKENREYAIKVNAHREAYLGGAQFSSDFGTAGGAPVSSPNPVSTDNNTGIQYAAADDPFTKGGMIDRIAHETGINKLLEKVQNAPGMRHQVVSGTMAERAAGSGTNTMIGNTADGSLPVDSRTGLPPGILPRATDASGIPIVPESEVGIPHEVNENALAVDTALHAPGAASTAAMPVSDIGVPHEGLQKPTSRIQLDGRTVPDLGGSGVKPTMQLADNTVTLDGKMEAIFRKVSETLDKIEGHVGDVAKQGASVSPKTQSQQPGTGDSVPYYLDDPLMNEYASNG